MSVDSTVVVKGQYSPAGGSDNAAAGPEPWSCLPRDGEVCRRARLGQGELCA